MSEQAHRPDGPWRSGRTYCFRCHREWPCEPSELETRITALEAALARAEGNLTTACILIGNLLSSDDEADVTAGREFIDAVVAGWESTPTSAGVTGEEDRDG